MRTIAEPRSRAVASAGRTAASRRRAAPVPEAGPQPVNLPAAAIAVTTVRMLRIDEGLYVLRIGEMTGAPSQIAGMAVPAAHISAPFTEDRSGVEIVASFPGRGPWLSRGGGTVIVRSPRGGGHVIVTVYGDPGQQTDDLSVDLRRLDDGSAPAPAAAPVRPIVAPTSAPVPPEGRDIPTEIMLHLEQAGDRLFPGRGWVGALGRRVRIEAFSMRPLEGLLPADVEMKGFMPSGGETAWIPGGALCGTRGQGLPLVGFAIRIAPQHANRFDIQYQGSFFAAGISQLCQNGETCRAPTGEDPLEAINIRLVERGTDPARNTASR